MKSKRMPFNWDKKRDFESVEEYVVFCIHSIIAPQYPVDTNQSSPIEIKKIMGKRFESIGRNVATMLHNGAPFKK